MNLAVVRGPYLAKREMWCYEPLTRYFNVTAYGTSNVHFNYEIINLPVKKLRSPETLLRNDARRFWKAPFRLTGWWHYMIGLERELKCADIIDTMETFFAFSHQAIKAKERYDAKVAVTVEENIPHSHENLIFKKYFKNVVKRKADVFIARLAHAKKALMLQGIPEEKIFVIRAGVDLGRFKPQNKEETLLERFNLTENDFVILFAGRFVTEKGVCELILAFRSLVDDLEINEDSVKLVLVGDGPLKNHMMKLIDNLKISDKVRFTGHIPYMDMHKFYNLADIFCLPSKPTEHWQEQCAYSLVEAMACGTPVVSTFCGSIPEVVGEAGKLAPANDYSSLYSNLKELVLNDSKRRQLAILARKRTERIYDAKKIAIELKEMYERLV